MYPRKTRSTRAPGHGRALVWVTLFTLFLSLITPLATIEIADARAAQGVPPDCDPGFVVSADGATCIEDPTTQPPDVPTETPETPIEESPLEETPVETSTEVVEPTAITTEVATEEAVSETQRLTINVFRCDQPAFDPYDPGSVQMVLEQCTGQGSGTFEIQSSIPAEPQTGSALEFQVGSGLTINETPAAEHGDPIASCFLYDPAGNVAGQVGPGVASGGTWAIGDIDGAIHCDWYQIEQGDQPALNGKPSRIVIQTSICPQDAADPAMGFESIAEACSERVEGITFQATSAGGYDQTKVSTNSGTAIFEELPAGEATVTASIPNGYGEPIVYCQWFSRDNGTPVSPTVELVPVENGRIVREVKTGHDLSCSWYNVPVASTATGSITLVTYNCPPGFDPATIDSNPRSICSTAPSIEFDVDDTIDDGESYEIATDAGGLGTRGKLPPDTYTIRQFVPNGVTSSFTWGCYDRETTTDPTDPIAMGSVFRVDLAAGMDLRCDVFNVTGGSGRVVVSTHGCGTDVPAYSLPLDQLFARCSIDTGRIEYFVGSSDSAYRETRTASKNPLTLASFDNVPTGDLSISAKLPGGWSTPIVYCQVLGADGSIESPPTRLELLVGRQVDSELGPGQTLGCDWFNVTQGNLQVKMLARTCPEGFDAYRIARENGAIALSSNCPLATEPVEFTVQGSGTYLQQKPAPAGGFAYWADAPSGELGISQNVAEGYGTPIVFCDLTIDDGNIGRNVQGFVDVGIGARITYDAPPGQKLLCTWYNVPGGSGYVSIYTEGCPDGFDIHNASRLQFEQSCNEPIGRVDFTVTSGSFTQTGSATNLRSYIDFPSVPTGDLTIAQSLKTDYNTAAVYCWEQVQGRPVTPQERVEVSGDLTVALPLKPNGWQTCEWYLANTPDGSVTVTKWECPESIPPSQDRTPYQAKCIQSRDGVDFTVTGIASSTTQTTANGGKAQWTGVQPGLVTITEKIPDGYGQPVVFCTGPKMNRSFPVTNGTIEYEMLENGYLTCDWYNVPLEKGHVIVYKGVCPEGTTADHDAGWYLEKCARPLEGVTFTLTHGSGSQPGTTNATGQVQWVVVPLGPYSLQEHIPSGYGDPVVSCTNERDNMLTGPAGRVASGGYLEGELTPDAKRITCHWYNIPAGHNIVEIHKYTCPAGYDPHTQTANPEQDCTPGPNGVSFHIGGSATDLRASTGDTITNGVRFTDLPSGTYTVTEEVPEGTASTYVWSCTGQRMGELRPTPLATGSTLELTPDGGENITCLWLNVPGYEQGRLTVVKHHCATMTYTSDVDCEVYEGGQGFDLLAWNGEAWEHRATQSTDGTGRATFVDLEAGSYWLNEHDREWCHLESEQLSGDGGRLHVQDGQETIVRVYNCSGDPADQGKPPALPTKYPNTGSPPTGTGPDAVTELPAVGPIVGLLVLLAGLRRSEASALSGPGGAPDQRAWSHRYTRRQVAKGLGASLIGLLAPGPTITAQDEQTTPTGTPPDRLCLPATPTAGTESECMRGAVPTTLRIDAIGVDAPVEILETVGGVMQQPSDEVHVAWYKESARLGEIGNIWLAGHLNWWNTPEAVFANLGALREGDKVVLLDEEENVFPYAVEWVRQESNLEPPGEDVLGRTDHPALTLITCGGEWDSAISEYDERTVARAVRVDAADQDEASLGSRGVG